MLGKALSRWTMAWFASALAFLLASLGLAAAGVGGPGQWAEGPALALVHLFALGWLGQMMLGSLIQFAPVLTARALVLPGLALPALVMCSLGTAALAAGFLSLDGWEAGLPLLTLAPVVLGLAFGLAGAMLGATLVAARAWRQDEGRAVILALAALVALWATGGAMALALGGTGIGAALLPDGLPPHVLLGAGGWLTVSAMGVSYKLFPMFLIAPEQGGGLRRASFAAALAALGLVLAALALLLAEGDPAPPMLGAAGMAALAAALYLAEIRRIWQSRRRPRPEVNMRWSWAALGFLALAAALAVPGFALGGVWAEAAVFAALAGWLSTLTLAQMIKITSFLTWLQIFAPQIGRAKIPLVHELTDARPTARWLALWAAGAGGGTLALLMASPLGFRLAVLVLLAAALGLMHEALAIRRLRHLPAARRPVRLPPIILPSSDRSSDHDHPRPAGA